MATLHFTAPVWAHPRNPRHFSLCVDLSALPAMPALNESIRLDLQRRSIAIKDSRCYLKRTA